ncbi:extracellular solute-binding protein [Butyrivibrio sp. VCD2006]|uniref:extracellular solute-binding protein n=1 Tax=Butyrivibrio sp. VCD2006 TaxID=1280664 RepID=UPI0003FDD16B|nr:extracellular solute-binding protein [Butyrivibrio sp. VCD2006]
MKKRGIALLLSLVMTASVVAGCGSSSKDAAKASGSDTVASEVDANAELTLPLCDEKTDISVWMLNDSTAMAKNGGDYNNNPYYKELEERTNVHINWQVPAAQTESEQFNLLFTSGELPDVMFYSASQGITYKDGLDAAVDDGYFLDLTDLLPKYAPHYLEALKKSSENVQKAAVTDEGRYVQIYSILQTSQPSFYGYVVRQDWLDDLGLSTPETYEDWENMLKAFKDEKGASAALSAYPVWLWNLGAGMGVYNLTDFYQENGEVKQALFNEPEKVREFLTLLNKWYNEGLIDPDFASETNPWGNSVLISNDSTGVTCTMYTIPSALFLPSMTDEDASFSALKVPVANAGDTVKSGYVVPDTNASWVISADCKNPELVLKWIDYMYTDEGALFGNYGKEGETFTMGDDGKPVFTDVIANNADGLSYDEAMRIYTYEPSWPGIYYDWERELQFVSQDDFKMCDTWNDFDHEATYYPSYATMNLDETAEYSDIFSDLSTYIQENLLSFVTGSKSLDEYDEFIDTVKSMNIERVIELKQAAYDRFNK